MSETLKKFSEIYGEKYDDLYNGKKTETFGLTEDDFDTKIINDNNFEKFVRAYNNYSNDIISSDREAMAFIIAYKIINPYDLPIAI